MTVLGSWTKGRPFAKFRRRRSAQIGEAVPWPRRVVLTRAGVGTESVSPVWSVRRRQRSAPSVLPPWLEHTVHPCRETIDSIGCFSARRPGASHCSPRVFFWPGPARPKAVVRRRRAAPNGSSAERDPATRCAAEAPLRRARSHRNRKPGPSSTQHPMRSPGPQAQKRPRGNTIEYCSTDTEQDAEPNAHRQQAKANRVGNPTSIYSGVSWYSRSNKWRAQFWHEGRKS